MLRYKTGAVLPSWVPSPDVTNWHFLTSAFPSREEDPYSRPGDRVGRLLAKEPTQFCFVRGQLAFCKKAGVVERSTYDPVAHDHVVTEVPYVDQGDAKGTDEPLRVTWKAMEPP